MEENWKNRSEENFQKTSNVILQKMSEGNFQNHSRVGINFTEEVSVRRKISEICNSEK